LRWCKSSAAATLWPHRAQLRRQSTMRAAIARRRR